jgi:hypothetical protein
LGIAVEPHGKCADIALVGFDALAARVDPLRCYNDIFYARFQQGGMKLIAEGPCVMARVELEFEDARILDKF